MNMVREYFEHDCTEQLVTAWAHFLHLDHHAQCPPLNINLILALTHSSPHTLCLTCQNTLCLTPTEPGFPAAKCTRQL